MSLLNLQLLDLTCNLLGVIVDKDHNRRLTFVILSLDLDAEEPVT